MSTGDPAYKLEKVFELLAWLFLPLVSGHVSMASPALPVRSLALSSSSLVGSAWVGGSWSAQLATHGGKGAVHCEQTPHVRAHKPSEMVPARRPSHWLLPGQLCTLT